MNLDERFWQHRQRALSNMGIVAAVLAAGFFLQDFFLLQQINLNMLALLIAMAITKFGTMFYLYWKH